jgi:signal transduction histidine kinase
MRQPLDKWRPTLGMIVTAVLIAILLLPLAGISFFRFFENQLIRQTEAELIAQSVALASTMAEKLKQEYIEDLPLGAKLPNQPDIVLNDGSKQFWQPLVPSLDLSSDPVLPPRPLPLEGEQEVHGSYISVGNFLNPILLNTQKVTLAGFRIMDFHGTVIAGRGDLGLSFAHLPEVKKALAGSYASVLRQRVVDNPQPIYSISRGTSIRLFVAMPVILNNRVAGVIYASRTPSNILKELYKQRTKFALAALFLLAITFLIGLIFSRAISGPIRRLTTRTTRIGNGEREAIKPLRKHGSREIFELSQGFLQMSEKLYERNDTINNFATHVTHELKSPLTSIRGAVELLLDNHSTMSQGERARFLENIQQDVERSTILLERLRTLARADVVKIDGTSNFQDVLATIEPEFPHLVFSINNMGSAKVAIAPENARIIFCNLFENALNHGADHIEINGEMRNGEQMITIKDNGSGISPGNADKLFDIFFTTRRKEGGTGMGLGIVRAIVKAHKGEIRLLSGEDGAVFELTLPVAIA